MPYRPDDPNFALVALLDHLRRSGVGFLPAADTTQVKALTAAWASTPAATDAPTIAEAAPARQTAVAPKTVASSPARTEPASRLAPAPPSHPVSLPTREPYATAKLPADQRVELLQAIAANVSGCTRCEVLSCQRRQTVPGEGSAMARVCFMGEAPGAEEDATGRPFVGPAGQLLTKMIEACTFKREQVYILNTIKCRPPNNRNPEYAEIENCREYLEAQLEIIQPEYIVCLGLVAAQALLHTKLSVGRLRGQFHAYRDSKVVVTYHPSYLLREPAVKKAAWADLQFMLRDMGINPTSK
jgi:DNA polymerase